MNKGRMPRLVCGPFLFALLLAACSDRSAPTAEENEQLNNAAEMLDAAPNLLSDIDENALAPPDGNEAGPAR